jgi:hypothetical protein
MAKVTNDDTRDVSILLVRRLIDLGYIEDNDDYYFDIQDVIQDEINDLLNISEANQQIEISLDKFEIEIEEIERIEKDIIN